MLACAPGLKSTLEPLVNRRRSQGWEVHWIEARESAKLARELAALGAGSQTGDTLLLVGAPGDWQGVDASCAQPGAVGITGKARDRATDSLLASDAEGRRPKFAVGRLPARSPAELQRMIAKIAWFEDQTTGQPWRKKAYCVLGNPMPGEKGSWLADRFISAVSKSLIKRMGKDWMIAGAADARGHPFDLGHQQFPTGAAICFMSPSGVTAFFGHSDQRGLFSRDELFAHGRDWDEISAKYRKGLFFTCGCHALNGSDAYGAHMIRANGGPVACMGAIDKSYSAFGYLAAKGLARGTDSNDAVTLGDWWIEVQKSIGHGHISPLMFFIFDHVDGSKGRIRAKIQRQEHLELWQLYGDPPMPLSPWNSPFSLPERVRQPKGSILQIIPSQTQN